MSSSSHLSPVPPGPCLVLDPDEINKVPDQDRQCRGISLLDTTKGDRLTCDVQPLGAGAAMSFALTWKQGWMLYSSSDQDNPCTFLHDPRTLNRIELPHFPHPLPRVFQCALSDKPTSTAGCVVVILNLDPPTDEPCFWYCRVGVMQEWIKHDYDVGSQQYDMEGLVWKKSLINNLTSCKGKFYFSNTGDEL